MTDHVCAGTPTIISANACAGMSARIGQHDIGGREEDIGPIDRSEKTLQEWELQMHSLVSLVSSLRSD